MLHIVNGDSFARVLADSGAQGEILVWRESLYEGPLSLNMDEPAIRQQRAEYFAGKGVPREFFEQNRDLQEKALSGFQDHDEVVMWFEYDLFDQAMLMFLLDWFSKRAMGNVRLSLLNIDRFPGVDDFRGLGQLNADQVRSLHGRWQPVSLAQLNYGREAWQAYASPYPQAIEQFLTLDDQSVPLLVGALKYHLTRFPSVYNGLTALEQDILSGIKRGSNGFALLFKEISFHHKNYGLGDAQFWGYLSLLANAASPLLLIDGPRPLPGYYDGRPVDLDQWTFHLTETGIKVSEGLLDYVSVNGVDRWVGGLHLLGSQDLWRWDPCLQRLLIV